MAKWSDDPPSNPPTTLPKPVQRWLTQQPYRDPVRYRVGQVEYETAYAALEGQNEQLEVLLDGTWHMVARPE